MRIPFLQQTGIGLHITSRFIRWVEISSVRNRISIERTVTHRVNQADTASSLKELVDKIRPSYPYVVANLDPDEVYRAVLEVPFDEDEDYLEEWLHEAPKQFLSEGQNVDDFRIVSQLMGDDQQGRRCLFMLATHELVEARIDFLQTAGLEAIALTSGDLETGYGLMFDTDFVTGNKKLIKAYKENCCLIEYLDGLPMHFYPLPSSESLKKIVEEAESLVISQSLHKNRDGADEVYAAIDKGIDRNWDDKSRMKVKEIQPLSHLTYEGQKLPAHQSVATGMAVKAVYPALGSINFLDKKKVRSNINSIEKKDAITTVGIIGGVMICLYLLITIINWNLTNKEQELDSQINRVQDKITVAKKTRKKVEQLKQNISNARSLVSGQTFVVQNLEIVAQAFSKGNWLHELDLKSASGWHEITLKGYAKSESLVSKLLISLENKKEIKKVQLVFSEKKLIADIFSVNKYREKYVILYEIKVQAVG